MKGLYIFLIILVIILFGPSILKYLSKFFGLLYKWIKLTGYKGVL